MKNEWRSTLKYFLNRVLPLLSGTNHTSEGVSNSLVDDILVLWSLSCYGVTAYVIGLNSDHVERFSVFIFEALFP